MNTSAVKRENKQFWNDLSTELRESHERQRKSDLGYDLKNLHKFRGGHSNVSCNSNVVVILPYFSALSSCLFQFQYEDWPVLEIAKGLTNIPAEGVFAEKKVIYVLPFRFEFRIIYYYYSSNRDIFAGFTCEYCGREVVKDMGWRKDYCPRCFKPRPPKSINSKVPSSRKRIRFNFPMDGRMGYRFREYAIPLMANELRKIKGEGEVKRIVKLLVTSAVSPRPIWFDLWNKWYEEPIAICRPEPTATEIYLSDYW